MEFMLVTAVPEVARAFEEASVERIFLDMETRGKRERQRGAGTPIYSHSLEDVRRVKAVLKQAKVLVRVNSLYDGTADEIDGAIDSGADIIMLPYFTHPSEVERFLELVRGRVRTNILIETAAAVGRAEQIFFVRGFDEVHFGLNDLRLTFGHDFLFEIFAGGVIEWLCSLARKAQVSFGIGGIGRVGRELVPAELIMSEHIRLGSERVILSRVFHGEAKTVEQLRKHVDLATEVQKLRDVAARAKLRSPAEAEREHLSFVSAVREIADTFRAREQSKGEMGIAPAYAVGL